MGVSVSLSEKEAHSLRDASRWKDFLKSLKDRGLHETKFIISDSHEGLGAARRAVFGSVPWQLCQFHLQQNAGAYVPRQTKKAEVAADIWAIFDAPVERLLKKTCKQLSRNMLLLHLVFPPGWKRTFQRASRFSISHLNTADRHLHLQRRCKCPCDEQSGACKQRDQASHPSGCRLPERSPLSAVGNGTADSNQ